MDAKKRYVALARVSSREQEREGFSLDIQVDALLQYADRNNGEIIRLFRIAETASKFDERTAFKELMAFAKKNSHKLDGLLFYKVDRAARNLFDYVELERGCLKVAHTIPYSDLRSLPENQRQKLQDEAEPMAFGHTLEDHISGQLEVGLQLTGMLEDRVEDGPDALVGKYIPTYMATCATKVT